MKLLQIEKPGKAVWGEAPIPEPTAGEVLVKVQGVTTCPHWDMHIMDGIPMFADRPLSYPYTPGEPGHEAVGEVVAVAPEVVGFEVGMRVAVWRDPGGRRQGCYAQYVAISAQDLILVPEKLAPEAIAPLELAMCVQASINRLQTVNGLEGKLICISGLGPAGLIGVQMARAYGAREIIGIDPMTERRDLAKQLGANVVLSPSEPSIPTDRFAQNSFETALDTTGLKEPIERLMMGTNEAVAMFGVLRDEVKFGPAQWWGGFALLGYGTHERNQAEQALQLIENGQLDLSTIVTHKLPLTRYAEGVDLLRQKKAIKILFLPWTDS